MIVVIGAALVIAAFGGAGLLLAGQEREKALCAEGYALLIKHICARLPSLAPMDEIVADFENAALKNAGALRLIKGENSVQPCNKRLLAAIELQKDDAELYGLLRPVAAELGSTDYERQKRSLDDAYLRLNELCEKRRARLESGEKCYKWLGVLAGVLTVILLL